MRTTKKELHEKDIYELKRLQEIKRNNTEKYMKFNCTTEQKLQYARFKNILHKWTNIVKPKEFNVYGLAEWFNHNI